MALFAASDSIDDPGRVGQLKLTRIVMRVREDRRTRRRREKMMLTITPIWMFQIMVSTNVSVMRPKSVHERILIHRQPFEQTNA